MNLAKIIMLFVALALPVAISHAFDINIGGHDYDQIVECPDGSTVKLSELVGDAAFNEFVKGCGSGFTISVGIAYSLEGGYHPIEGATMRWYDSGDVEDPESPQTTSASGVASIDFWLSADETYTVEVDGTYQTAQLHIGGNVNTVWVDCTP